MPEIILLTSTGILGKDWLDLLTSPVFISITMIFITSVAIGLSSGWLMGHKYSRRVIHNTKGTLKECRTILEEDIKPPPIEAIFLIREAQDNLEKMEEWNPKSKEK